jgi:hypothetical protein
MNTRKIFFIKLVHSVIFFFMVACLVYVFYCALAHRYDWALLLALIALATEGLALLLNQGRCPLADLARKHGDPNDKVTDIFLPLWCAPYTFKVSTVVVIIELIWLAWGYFR